MFGGSTLGVPYFGKPPHSHADTLGAKETCFGQTALAMLVNRGLDEWARANESDARSF